MNIYPDEGFTFAYCQIMHNIQVLTYTRGCNKYTIKYIGNIDTQNYVNVYADGHKTVKLVTKNTVS